MAQISVYLFLTSFCSQDCLTVVVNFRDHSFHIDCGPGGSHPKLVPAPHGRQHQSFTAGAGGIGPPWGQTLPFLPAPSQPQTGWSKFLHLYASTCEKG